ncbi:MAG: sugar O-acetyltransferase [Mucinivorans sp.]
MMTEQEKMISGQLYDCADRELMLLWSRAQKLTHLYNNTVATDGQRKNEILTMLLAERGQSVNINAPFHCDYGQNIYVGENCEINFGCVILDCNKVTIGDNVMIGPAVQIYTVTHPTHAAERMPSPGSNFCKAMTAPVTIEDEVWIGGGAIILPGVTIGRRSTIGAGSVVTKDIPPDSLAVGNPAKVVKHL